MNKTIRYILIAGVLFFFALLAGNVLQFIEQHANFVAQFDNGVLMPIPWAAWCVYRFIGCLALASLVFAALATKEK